MFQKLVPSYITFQQEKVYVLLECNTQNQLSALVFGVYCMYTKYYILRVLPSTQSAKYFILSQFQILT